MSRQSFDDILPLLRHPSHYLGSEINAVRKESRGVRLRFALAFPDLYEIGMCHLGIHILYHVLNTRKDIAAERVFAPRLELEAELRARNTPLCSLETRTPLSRFDIVGFSLLYELNFTNILNMLSLAGIPLYAKDRDESHPFVIAGGPCAFNPEPLADFFDAMVIGDGEEVVLQVADAWLQWKQGGGDRQGLLERWSRLQGVYIPSFFEAHTNSEGFQVLTPRLSGYTGVRKALVSDLDKAPYPDRPIIAFGRPVHDRLSLEVCRGCTKGCRFCQAGMIYRPVRERSPETVLSLAQRALANTGYEDISLLSLSTGDYGPIQGLMEQLMDHCEPDRVAVSLPSLRVGSLTKSLMTQIKRVRKTGFTVAPEAGSQRLREVINKNITEKALEETVRNAFGLGWQQIKLYFMIGLPTETEADLDAIVELAKRLHKIRPAAGLRKKITVSVSAFIPKAHTPFQWCPQNSLEESGEKIHMLRGKLRSPGLRVKWQNPEMSILEGLFARGDRRLAGLLVKAYEAGCRLDGWSDHFQYKRWQEAIDGSGVDVGFYTTRSRNISESLPWDHIDSGVSKEFLRDDLQKALTGTHTADCRDGECNMCGVCDLETIKPVTFQPDAVVKGSHHPSRASDQPVYKKLQVSYAKLGQAKYFGHLELTKIFLRAFRRARIPLRFSQGFHPAPKVSFESALPVGIESKEERFVVQVPHHVAPSSIVERVNNQLPEGLTITRCTTFVRQSPEQAPEVCHYNVALKEDTFSETKLDEFVNSSTCLLVKTNKKGHTKTVDLKQAVAQLHLVRPNKAQMTLSLTPGCHVRPTEVLGHIFGLSERTLKLATIVKEAPDTA